MNSRLTKCIAVLLCLCVFSCKKDFYTQNALQEKSIDFNINNAKIYFTEHVKNKKYHLSDSSVKSLVLSEIAEKRIPLWEEAKVSITSKGKTIKIPIDFGGVKVKIDGSGSVLLKSLSYLMMYTDSLGGIQTEWVVILPSYEWLYGKRELFKGEIEVMSWDGKLKKKYVYESNNQLFIPKVKSEIKSKSNSVFLNSVTNGLSSTSTDNDPIETGLTISICYFTPDPYWDGIDPCRKKRDYNGICDGCSICGTWKCVNSHNPPPPPPPPPPDEDPTGDNTGGSNNNTGGTPAPIYVGGSGNGSDYTPLSCNPDPNYVVPNQPPPPGMEWVLPCGGDPTEEQVPIPALPGTELTSIEALGKHLSIDDDASKMDFLNNRSDVYDGLSNYLFSTVDDGRDRIGFSQWAFNYLFDHQNINWIDFKGYYENNKTDFDNNNTGDIDNNSDVGFDNSLYDDFDPDIEVFPTINPVISTSDFIGWGHTGIPKNCMDYAKAQIKIKGYQISNYGASGQTIQIYTSQNGVDKNATNKGISYLKYALTNNIPVIVGVDDVAGSSNPQTDNTTDHFVVIVGMGNDSNGNFFRFYDNASGDVNQGTNVDNKLYYNSSTGKITGSSKTSYGQGLTYTLTMIRKSKHL